jgi:hypothetical protein
MIKQRLWELPEGSTTGVSGFVLLTTAGGDLDLYFDYVRNGAIYTGGLRFGSVRAHRHRAELYLTAWHITDAYEALVEVTASDWLAELTRAAPADRRHEWPMRHFMIMFDSDGCYEVAAATWEVRPEVQGRLSAVSAHLIRT